MVAVALDAGACSDEATALRCCPQTSPGRTEMLGVCPPPRAGHAWACVKAQPSARGPALSAVRTEGSPGHPADVARLPHWTRLANGVH